MFSAVFLLLSSVVVHSFVGLHLFYCYGDRSLPISLSLCSIKKANGEVNMRLLSHAVAEVIPKVLRAIVVEVRAEILLCVLP